MLMEEFSRAAVVELFARERITVFPAVPLIFDLLARRVMGQSRPGNSLRLAFSAGAPLAAAVAREFREAFGVYIRQVYGTTETRAEPLTWTSTFRIRSTQSACL